MSTRKFVSLFFMLFFIIIVGLLGGRLSTIFNAPSIIIVLGGVVSISLIALRPSEIIHSLFNRTDSGLNKTTVDFLGNSFVMIGSIGTLIGLILMLANLSDPDALIPGIAVAFITLVYGFIFKFIVDSFHITLPSQISSSESLNRTEISKASAILGIVLFFVFAIITILLGGSPMLFVNAPSVMIVVLGGLAAVLVTNSRKDIFNSLKGGFGGTYDSVEDAKDAVRVTSNMYNRFISFGFIGVMIGLFLMFSHLNDPDALGPGMAVALISFFYALCLTFIILAFNAAARRQVNWYGEDEIPYFIVSPTTSGLFSIGLILASFAALLSAF